MPKASPLLRAFNGGVASVLMDGRTDLDKYPMLLRQSLNGLPTPQGPWLARSGTEMRCPVYDESLKSYLLEFVFSNDPGQSYAVEAADGRFRWHSDAGLLAYSPAPVVSIANSGGFLQINAPLHASVVDDQTVISGLALSTGLEGRVANITAVAGANITTDIPYQAIADITTMKVARVYHVTAPYTSDDVENIRFVNDRDALYLFCEGFATRKLSRYGAYDWRLAEHEFIDGPYDDTNETATTLTPSGTGNVVPNMTADVTGGYTASASGGANPYKAFDGDNDTYWDSAANQTGTLQIQLPGAVAVDGYSIQAARINSDTNYKSLDYAPGTWTFEGSNDGATWAVLDSVVSFVNYTNLRSNYFKLKNKTPYLYYRLKVTQCTRNGGINVRVGGLHMSSRATAVITLTASGNEGINFDQGFKATDVGRLVRIEGDDGLWHYGKITARSSATTVSFEVKGDVLSGVKPTTEWRLGLFSETTGYPTCGTFFEDRLCMGGMSGYPDHLVCTVQGKYDTITQTDPDGTVNDDNGIVVRVNSRKIGRVQWIGSDNRSLLLGTATGEWQVSSADLQTALTARTAKARRASSRGSASVEPVFIDRNGLYVQRGYRTLREIGYNFDIDAYAVPSMSLLASDMGVDGFKQLVFCQEPLAIVWARTASGELKGFTYNKEENIRAWHGHNVGGVVEALAALPGTETIGPQDRLWMIVKRTINGQTRRFIERMAETWDFGHTINDAFYVDCGLRYEGPAINQVYGFNHLIGETVSILSNGSTVTPQVVAADGSITLPNGRTTTNLVAGLGYNAYGESMRIEAGAGDGTAQGKEKRVTRAVLRLWQSVGGKFGTRKADDSFDVNNPGNNLEDIRPTEELTNFDTPAELFTGDTRVINMPDGYNKSGSLIWLKPADQPLPFNVVAIAPQLNTQDR